MFFNQDFYPLPFGKYVVFFNSSEEMRYSFWKEVFREIAPELKALKIEPVLIDRTEKTQIEGHYTLRDLTATQTNYLLNSAEQIFSFEPELSAIFSQNINITNPSLNAFNDFTRRPADLTQPDAISRKVFEVLRINKSVEELSFYGPTSDKTICEFVPDFPLSSMPLVSGHSVIRFDCGGKYENIVGFKFDSIIVDSSNFDFSSLYKHCNTLYIIVDNVSLKDIEEIRPNTILLCKNKELLAVKRNEYIDYKVQLLSKEKRGCLLGKDLSNHYCMSNKTVYASGQKFNTISHWKKGLTFSERFDILDDESFWEGQDFLRIYKTP